MSDTEPGEQEPETDVWGFDYDGDDETDPDAPGYLSGTAMGRD